MREGAHVHSVAGTDELITKRLRVAPVDGRRRRRRRTGHIRPAGSCALAHTGDAARGPS